MADKVIFYTYASSPMFHKIRNVLIIKQIPYSIVTVSIIPPRPELRDHLGVTYRRIPILAIGNDLFFDTALMLVELEKRFTPENGHPALLETLGGLQEATSFWWSDRQLFSAGSALLPGKMLSQEMIKDRSEFLGSTPNGLKTIDQRRPAALSVLRSHLASITKQLEQSNTPFLLGTTTPSYLDISIYTIIAWVQNLRTAPGIITPSSKAAPGLFRAMSWFEAVRDTISTASKTAPKPENISAEEAAQIVLGSARVKNIIPTVDKNEPMVAAGWLQEGARVSVTPNDTGRVPQVGTLVGLNDETTSVRVNPVGNNKASCIAHFPRLGYTVKAEKQPKSARL